MIFYVVFACLILLAEAVGDGDGGGDERAPPPSLAELKAAAARAEKRLKHNELVTLDESNFTDYLRERAGTYVFLFYADYCAHSAAFRPTFARFARWLRSLQQWPNLYAAKIDCAHELGQALCTAYNVKGYPSVLAQSDTGEQSEFFSDRRELPALQTWLQSQSFSPQRKAERARRRRAAKKIKGAKKRPRKTKDEL